MMEKFVFFSFWIWRVWMGWWFFFFFFGVPGPIEWRAIGDSHPCGRPPCGRAAGPDSSNFWRWRGSRVGTSSPVGARPSRNSPNTNYIDIVCVCLWDRFWWVMFITEGVVMEVIPITLSHFFWNNIQANSKDYFSFFLFFFVSLRLLVQVKIKQINSNYKINTTTVKSPVFKS